MSAPSSYVLKLVVPRSLRVQGTLLSREDFFEWLWERFGGSNGLQGVHEGTLLSEQAAEAGLETESWTLDAAEAPRERDWVGGTSTTEAELFFETEEHAKQAQAALLSIDGLAAGTIREQKAEDWDAQWKASFLGNTQGVKVPPFWRILPPWVTPEEAAVAHDEIVLRINPGAGFGTGTHETTQLCLEAIGNALRGKRDSRVLDFGSGSGILSIGAALVGGKVEGVEIDPLAIDNALENAQLNRVETRVQYSRTLERAQGPYVLVIANILKPVLLEFASELVQRMAPQSTLILSGLVAKDVADVTTTYSSLLGGLQPQLKELGDWRALVWRRGQ